MSLRFDCINVKVTFIYFVIVLYNEVNLNECLYENRYNDLFSNIKVVQLLYNLIKSFYRYNSSFRHDIDFNYSLYKSSKISNTGIKLNFYSKVVKDNNISHHNTK